MTGIPIIPHLQSFANHANVNSFYNLAERSLVQLLGKSSRLNRIVAINFLSRYILNLVRSHHRLQSILNVRETSKPHDADCSHSREFIPQRWTRVAPAFPDHPVKHPAMHHPRQIPHDQVKLESLDFESGRSGNARS
jgi:hypothetical protein